MLDSLDVVDRLPRQVPRAQTDAPRIVYSLDKLSTALADAQVDLNPHQVDAALFAFRSPFSKGAILADEVGLGKTIEGGLLLAQKWAERKRRLLVIVPANLRKQWSQELHDKFHLPSVILETKTFNESVRGGNLNPLQQDAVVLCSYQFASTKDAYVRQTPWDLVVIDEAHRLRNVYKPTNKIANAIKDVVAHAPKVLLTATPLQNSLQELYGLVSVIDDAVFGDIDSFKRRFGRRGHAAESLRSNVSAEVLKGIEGLRRYIQFKGGRVRFTDAVIAGAFQRHHPEVTLEKAVFTGAALGLLEIAALRRSSSRNLRTPSTTSPTSSNGWRRSASGPSVVRCSSTSSTPSGMQWCRSSIRTPTSNGYTTWYPTTCSRRRCTHCREANGI